MKNKYIKSVMDSKNEFRIKAEFIVFNTYIVVDNLKIDTGCNYTTFPFQRIGAFTEKDALDHKRQDIIHKVSYALSYGVETGGQNHNKPVTVTEKMQCTAMGFFKPIRNFKICDVDIGNRYIRVNYDRKGNLLLGMDILKDWDIHIDTIDTGETIFLACPKYMINDEYLCELEKTFHVGTEVCSAIARGKIN